MKPSFVIFSYRCIFFPFMWDYRHHFHIKDVNDGCVTQDCGVEFKFNQSSHASHHDWNLIGGRMGYVRKIQEIIQVDFSAFQCVYYRCRWWDTFDRYNVKEDCDSGLICINSRICGMEVRSLMFSQNNATKFSFTQMCWIEIDGSY